MTIMEKKISRNPFEKNIKPARCTNSTDYLLKIKSSLLFLIYLFRMDNHTKSSEPGPVPGESIDKPGANRIEASERSTVSVAVQSDDPRQHAKNHCGGGGGGAGRRRMRVFSGPSTSNDGGNLAGSRPRKRRRRRGRAKQRRYKPYMKMTWDEKRELESREEKRAENVRRERFQSGIPVAPYNTTQFLLQVCLIMYCSDGRLRAKCVLV